MFDKNGFKLKSEFRKMLKNNNKIYKDPVNENEEKSLQFMWQTVFGDSACILISRFQRQKIHLGFRICTTIRKAGYEHKVSDVIEYSDIDLKTKICPDDILLEVNGINLLQLKYCELIILLANLPQNVQLIYMRKENEYEKVMDYNNKTQTINNHISFWMYPVHVIIQRYRKQFDGLEFCNKSSSHESVPKCVISRIDPNGYIFKDRRLSINDAILRINNINVENHQTREMVKILMSEKKCFFSLFIRKYYVTSALSNFNNWSSQSAIEASEKNSENDSVTKICPTENQIICVNLNQKDDLGIYLIDIFEPEKKSIICGFNAHSKLKTKFKIGDEIIKINEENVEDRSSYEIGKFLKISQYNFYYISVTIRRTDNPYDFKHSIILPSELENVNYEGIYSESEESLIFSSDKSSKNQEMFTIAIKKINKSFGLFIKTLNGPTIVGLRSESDIYKRNILKIGDKIVRINNIYVLDKNYEFIYTLISSCGNKMILDIWRPDEFQGSTSSIQNSV